MRKSPLRSQDPEQEIDDVGYNYVAEHWTLIRTLTRSLDLFIVLTFHWSVVV